MWGYLVRAILLMFFMIFSILAGVAIEDDENVMATICLAIAIIFGIPLVICP